MDNSGNLALDRLAKYVFIAIVTGAILFIIWYFKSIVAYVLASVVLSFLGKPIMHLLSKVRYKSFSTPRSLSAAVAILLMWLVFALSIYMFIPLIVTQANEFSSINISSLTSTIDEPLHQIDLFVRANMDVEPDFSLKVALTQELSQLINVEKARVLFGSVAGFIKGAALAAFSITFITFFFLKEEGLFFQFIVLLFPQRLEQNITRALHSVNNLLMRYFVGIFVEMVCMLSLFSLGLIFIAGIPFKQAILIALIAAVLNVIPYVGPLIGAFIGLLMVFVSSMHMGFPFVPVAIKLVGVIIVAQLLDNAVLQPFIYSNSVKAHPLEIFLVIMIAGGLFGVMGMLVAIPTYTILRVFAKEFFNHLRVVKKLTENI